MIAVVLFVVAFAAFVVSAVAGGGAGLVLVPVLRAMLPIEAVPAALSIGTATSSVSRIAVFRRSIRWDVVRGFVPAALPAAALGAWLLTRFEPAYVELLLACFLLANLPALLRRRAVVEAAPRPAGRGMLAAMGAAAGLLSGFTGAVGLLFNRAYGRWGLSKDEIVATRAANEVALHLLKIALYAWFGLLTRPALLAGLLVAGAALLAAVAMRWLLPLIHEGLFRRVGLGAMVASGAALFTLSSGQLMTLHRAWVAHVEPGGEHEVQLYWQGERHFAIEIEDNGMPVLERRVAFARLPAAQQAEAAAIVHPARITLVEEVLHPGGRSWEVHWQDGGRERIAELG